MRMIHHSEKLSKRKKLNELHMCERARARVLDEFIAKMAAKKIEKIQKNLFSFYLPQTTHIYQKWSF